MKANAPAAAEPVAPLDADEFRKLMAAFGPFEGSPIVAVGVSGGPDSMVLCALTDDWARQRGGRALALIVDHRLRPESGDEARRVGDWLDDLGVNHVQLTRDGPGIHAAIHAAARAARYRLMEDCCRGRGILHLLLAHHRDDQAETFLLRLERASGLDGLAAMAAVVEGIGLRLLRPLLGIPAARLRATLAARGLRSVDDPSNRNPAFGRTRIRRLVPVLAADGVTTARLARTAAALGRARRITEGAVAGFLATAVIIHPAGFCRLDGEIYRAAPDEIAKRALARVLICIGGSVYGPRGIRLQRLHEALSDGSFEAGRTLGNCRVLPRPRGILICREPRGIADPVILEDGGSVLWDQRFLLRAPAGGTPFSTGSGSLMVRRLDQRYWCGIPPEDRKARRNIIPGAVRACLPAVCDLDGVVAIPHLGYMRSGTDGAYTVEFRPTQGLSPGVFAFAGTAGSCISSGCEPRSGLD